MSTGDWPVAAWPFVRAHLPDPPARVIEVGCGPDGGFVPVLASNGYDAVGVDPQAPDAAGYRRASFERFRSRQPAHAVIASLSLHHVDDLDAVLDTITAALVPHGVLVVAEFDWEHFDELTARWCFARLGPVSKPGMLRERQQAWLASGGAWDTSLHDWAHREHCHTWTEITHALNRRFLRSTYESGPYFFADLPDTTEATEQAAIDAGEIRATGIRYAGRLRAQRVAGNEHNAFTGRHTEQRKAPNAG